MRSFATETRSRWWPLVAICMGTFMLLVDVTIVSVALPSMARDLHARLASLQWVIDAYALALAALLLLSGSLADRFGRRRLFQIGLGLFAVASLGCALAPSAGVLIAARAVQGVGAAAMFATNTALLSGIYKGRDRSVAFGVWGAITGAAAAIAPVLGGLLIAGFDWRAIFLVNLPIAVLTLALTRRVVGESHGEVIPIDWAGAASFTISAGSVIFALIHGGESGWTTAGTLVAFAVAALAMVVFLFGAQRRRSPLIDLALFRDPSFTALMLAAILLTAAAFAPTFYTQLWLQSVLRLSAIDAGLVVAPLAALAFVVSATAGRFTHRVPPRFPLGIGLLLIGAGALLRTDISAQSDWTALTAGLVVSGVGVGLASPVLVSAALAAAPGERAGMASGIVNTFRQLGYALGIALLGTFFSSQLERTIGRSGVFPNPHSAAIQAGQGQAQALIAATSHGRRTIASHVIHAAYATGQNHIYLLAGLAAALGGVLVLALVRPRRSTDAEPQLSAIARSTHARTQSEVRDTIASAA